MARAVRDRRITSRSNRTKLTQRREPYWTPISKGCAVGYRRGAKGGSWVARWRGEDGKQHYEALGAADDAMDADGHTILSYDQAQAAAREWFKLMERQQTAGVDASRDYTVADCMRDYIAELRARGSRSAGNTQTRSDAHIIPQLGALPVHKLTTKQIRDWHRKMAETPPRARTPKGKPQAYRSTAADAGATEHDADEALRKRRNTANRTLTPLKAALNHAYTEGKVASDDAWRRVVPFKEADAAKIDYLEEAEQRALVDAAERNFRPLVLGALLTGCRYEELTRLRCSDFDRNAGTVFVERSKSNKPRRVVLSAEGIAFFDAYTAGRPGEETIFLRYDDRAWGKSHQFRPMNRAVEAAGIGRRVTFNILRHTYGSQLAMRGVPMAVIAANMGHSSTRMTERHYAHLAPSYVASTIRDALSSDAGLLSGQSNVVPLKRPA